MDYITVQSNLLTCSYKEYNEYYYNNYARKTKNLKITNKYQNEYELTRLTECEKIFNNETFRKFELTKNTNGNKSRSNTFENNVLDKMVTEKTVSSEDELQNNIYNLNTENNGSYKNTSSEVLPTTNSKLDKKYSKYQQVFNYFKNDDIAFNKYNDIITNKENIIKNKFILKPYDGAKHKRSNTLITQSSNKNNNNIFLCRGIPPNSNDLNNNNNINLSSINKNESFAHNFVKKKDIDNLFKKNTSIYYERDQYLKFHKFNKKAKIYGIKEEENKRDELLKKLISSKDYTS